MLPVKTLPERVKRTRANIAIDDPKAGDAEQKQSALALLGAGRRKHSVSRVSNDRNQSYRPGVHRFYRTLD